MSKPLVDVIEEKARKDGRYAIAWVLLEQATELRQLRRAVADIAVSINHLGDAIQRMRPMVTVETAPVPAHIISVPESEAT